MTLSVASVLMVLVYWAHFHFSDRAREKSLFSYWLTLSFPIAAMLIPLVVKQVSYRYLTLRSSLLYVTGFAARFNAMLAALVVIFAASNRIAATVIASRYVNPAGLNAQLIRIISKLASLVAAVILFLVGGQYLGIPIATLLASAGIGGIHIPLDSSCKKMEQAVAIIREELNDHEGMDPDLPPRVFFDEFTPGAFTIQFTYWYSPPDDWRFKAFGDKLNLNIFRRFEAQGIQFSLPLRHSFWKRDNVQGPLDVNLLSPGTEGSGTAESFGKRV